MGSTKASRPLRASAARSRPHGPAAFWIVPGMLLGLVLAAGASSGDERGHEAKAELLYRVAKFIEWPGESTATALQKEFTFAILGEDDLAGVLAATWSTKTIGGRPVFVRCVRRAEDVKGSQILFIAASEEKRVPEVLSALQGQSVLTVADIGSFAAQGGMVDFVLDKGKVHFEINPGIAERAGLKISAKLLALAHIVDDQP